MITTVEQLKEKLAKSYMRHEHERLSMFLQMITQFDFIKFGQIDEFQIFIFSHQEVCYSLEMNLHQVGSGDVFFRSHLCSIFFDKKKEELTVKGSTSQECLQQIITFLMENSEEIFNGYKQLIVAAMKSSARKDTLKTLVNHHATEMHDHSVFIDINQLNDQQFDLLKEFLKQIN